MTLGNKMTRKIDQRIALVWKRYGQYNTFLRYQGMSICWKEKAMNTVVTYNPLEIKLGHYSKKHNKSNFGRSEKK